MTPRDIRYTDITQLVVLAAPAGPRQRGIRLRTVGRPQYVYFFARLAARSTVARIAAAAKEWPTWLSRFTWAPHWLRKARLPMTRLTRSASPLPVSCLSSDIILDHRLISPSSHPAHGFMLKSWRSLDRVRYDLLWTGQLVAVRAHAAAGSPTVPRSCRRACCVKTTQVPCQPARSRRPLPASPRPFSATKDWVA